MTNLLSLADRVEKAEAGSRELDLIIHLAIHPDGDIARIVKSRRGFDHEDGLTWDIHGASICYENYSNGRCWSNGGYPLLAYTGAIDAAMSLVPEGWSILAAWNGRDAICTVHLKPLGDPNGVWPPPSTSNSQALALCAAALRAIASREKLNG